MPVRTRIHRNLHRIDRGLFQGWRVSLSRANVTYERYFHDQQDREAALVRALRWRDAMIRRLPPPVHLHRRSAVNTSGYIGVSRTNETTRQGKPMHRWVAIWADGLREHKRSFSVNKYGEERARAQAIAARKKAVAEMLATRPKGPLPPRITRPRKR